MLRRKGRGDAVGNYKGGKKMNALINQADSKTHLKIIVVALFAAILIVVMGIRAHIGA